MDKIWIVLLFLGVFLIGSNLVKRMMIRFLSSADRQSSISVITAEKEDPVVFWREEGKRRLPENAEYELLEKDFFEKEENEFAESFEEEFSNLSDEEINSILEEAELLEKGGDSE